MKKVTLLIILMVFITISSVAQSLSSSNNKSDYQLLKQQINANINQDMSASKLQHIFSNKNKIQTYTSEYGDPPDWNWANQFGGSGYDAGNDIVTDVDGNIYVGGTFSGNISISANSFTSSGHHDGFVAKFNSTGNLVRFSQFLAEPDHQVEINGMCIDNTGNVFVSGYYTGTINSNGIILGHYEGQNLFIAKLNLAGEVILAKTYLLPSGIDSKISLDQNGNIYVIGSSYYASTLLKYSPNGTLLLVKNFNNVDFKGIAHWGTYMYLTGTVYSICYFDQIVLEPKGYNDAFLAKCDLDGSFAWAVMGDHPIEYGGRSRGMSISLDNNNDIYIGGDFNKDVIFGMDTLEAPDYYYYGFLAKYDPSGNEIWARMVEEGVGDITIDMNNNPHILFTNHVVKFDQIGTRQWTSQMDDTPSCLVFSSLNKLVSTGEREELAFVCQMDQNAIEDWTVEFDGDSGQGHVIGMVTDKNKNFYTYAYSSAEMDYFGQTIQKGTFLAKHNGKGELIWIRQFEGFYHDYAYIGTEIVIDPKCDYVYISGIMTGPLKIPGGTTLFPEQDGGFFILKYNVDGTIELAIQEDIKASYPPCLAADYTGNIIISGTFEESATIGGVELVSAGSLDAFIIKYSPIGAPIWAKRAGGDDIEYSGIISVDGFDNIYLSGEFCSENITVDNTSVVLGEGDGNVLLAKLSAAGHVNWVKSYSGSTAVSWADYWCWPTGIKTDSMGYTYLKGWHTDSCYFDNILLKSPYSKNSFFITRIDPSGNVIWANSINRRRNVGYDFDYNDMDIDSHGSVYFGAQAKDTLNFGNVFMYLNIGICDLFVAKYTINGMLDWVKIIKSGEKGYSTLSNITVYDTLSFLAGGYFGEYLAFGGIDKKSANRHGFVALLGEDITGVEEVFNRTNPDLKVYPNPSAGKFYIEFENKNFGIVDVQVINSTGQVIIESIFDMHSINQIDLSDRAKGLYILRPINNTKYQAIRLIVE